MYTMSSKIKLTAIILMVVGAIGLIYGFVSVPDSVDQVQEMLAAEHSHHAAADASADAHHDDTEHAEHVLHQLQNKPWASIYTAALFFFLIAVGAFAFYAVQNASQAGWSPLLFRVMEAISTYILPGGVIVYVLLVLSSLEFNHLFVWMDPEVVKHDEIIANKTGYLNVPFFLLRAAIYIGGWAFFSWLMRKNSRKLDEQNDMSLFKKNFKVSAIFLVFFIVTESMMSWDFIMSIDTHWFSTLFGWFVFASMFVSGITVIALVTIYLKSKGYLEEVNNSHIHDLAKFMFGISIFWEYLWFSQFLLIWYANIPEEVVYYVTRIEDYPLLFFGSFALNFVFPMLVLLNSDFKRVNWIVSLVGIVILIGHYVNFYVLIMPGTVGESWSFGVAEIGSVLLIGGLFLYLIFNGLTKAPLIAKNYPLLKESKHFHY
ncbi:MAG: quinol:cytochrome C oxidoreductase [Bacteroidota bacterium]